MIEAEQQLDRARAFLSTIPGGAERAMSRALNRAAATAREKASAAIQSRYAVRASDVEGMLTLTTAKPGDLRINVRARSRSLSVGYFPHAPSTPGTGGKDRPVLHAEIKRGAPAAIPGAFVARVGGRLRVMIRTGAKTAKGAAAMRSVYTIPLASMLGVTDVRRAVEESALEVLGDALDREIDRELGKVAS